MGVYDTFTIRYQFTAGSQNEAEATARNISLEQTAELPESAVPAELLKYTGVVSKVSQTGDLRWECSITYPAETAGGELTQFLNVLFGNISLKPGIRILSLEPGKLAGLFPGPNFGISGIRELTGVSNRALSCTALKPMGAGTTVLSKQAFEFASGGLDIIKDDHGLANQSMASFEERVRACTEAVKKGCDKSGKRTLYLPNVTGDSSSLLKRAEFARKHGADGVLLAPQITGLAEMAQLTKTVPDLPVMAHPAFSGPYTIHQNSGFEPAFYYGFLWKILGADAIIYPNTGGRFSFSPETCAAINGMCRHHHPGVGKAFPVPGGGISRESIPAWIETYGRETIFLIGGSLYQHPGGLKTAAEEFQVQLKANA